MKQKLKLLMMLGVLCSCLCACEGETMTQGDKYWVDAQSAALSLQQFKIVSLLCTYEYQCLSEADDTEISFRQWLAKEDELRMFGMYYPDSSPYANAYLKKVNTATDEFWERLDGFLGVLAHCWRSCRIL